MYRRLYILFCFFSVTVSFMVLILSDSIILSLSLLVLLGFLLLVNSFVVKLSLNANSYFQFNSRNFDSLILGSTYVWKAIRKNKYNHRNTISFAFYGRNIFISFLILKHVFSFLKKNGKILFFIDLNNDLIDNKKLSYVDKLIMHDISLKKLMLKRAPHFYSVFPIFFQFIFSCKLMISLFLNKNSSQELNYESISTFASKINEFCQTRQLRLHLVFINYNKSKIDKSELLNLFSTSQLEVDFTNNIKKYLK